MGIVPGSHGLRPQNFTLILWIVLSLQHNRQGKHMRRIPTMNFLGEFLLAFLKVESADVSDRGQFRNGIAGALRERARVMLKALQHGSLSDDRNPNSAFWFSPKQFLYVPRTTRVIDPARYGSR